MLQKLCNELLNYIHKFDLKAIKDFQRKNLTFDINQCNSNVKDKIVDILAEDRYDEGIQDEEKFDLLEILLKDLNLDPNIGDGDLIYHAILQNNYDVIELLINYGYRVFQYYEDVIVYALDELSDDLKDEIERYIISITSDNFKQ